MTANDVLNMGPHHPSTHGVLRLLLELDGEEIVTCLPDIGFLHTGIEKTIESKPYEKGLVCTDRMDYLAPMSNNTVFCMAVEKLVGLDVPERAQVMRVLCLELTRIQSHLVWLGTHAIDLGAMSVFLYCFREREKILDMFEMLSGQRMMGSYIRPGGVWRDFPPEFIPALEAFLDDFPSRVDDYEKLLTTNPLARLYTGARRNEPDARWRGASAVPACEAAASTGISARPSRISVMNNTISMSHSASTVTSTTVISAASARCVNVLS